MIVEAQTDVSPCFEPQELVLLFCTVFFGGGGPRGLEEREGLTKHFADKT